LNSSDLHDCYYSSRSYPGPYKLATAMASVKPRRGADSTGRG
jgi:hypothetical protein